MYSGPLGIRTPRMTRGFERRARGRPRLVYKPHGVRDWPPAKAITDDHTSVRDAEGACRRRRGKRKGMLGYPVEMLVLLALLELVGSIGVCVGEKASVRRQKSGGAGLTWVGSRAMDRARPIVQAEYGAQVTARLS
jgi:hypothetical protein